MARLSIADLNNLSGVSDDKLKSVYNDFRVAHTELFNRLTNWIDTCEKSIEAIKNLSDEDNIVKYRKVKGLYYSGGIVLDDLDLFMSNTDDYISTLSKLNKSKDVSNVRMLCSLLKTHKKDVVNLVSECYGLSKEYYKSLYEEDINEG